jgi:hypothetical protein
MTIQGHEESDQRPEDAPGGQVPDDDGEAGSRDQAEENPGAAESEDEQATGNPAAAGSEDPEDDSE